jgi:cell division control protein 45
VDLEEVLGLDGQSVEEGAEPMDMTDHGVEVWVIDGRRPWNLSNVFGSSASIQQTEEGAMLLKRQGVDQGRILPHYAPGKGGIIVWDDGDIHSDLSAEREAYAALQDMPEITEEDLDIEQGDTDDEGEDEPGSSQSRKRKAASQDSDDDNSENEDYDRPRQRRRSNSSMPIPSSPGGNPYSNQSVSATPPTSSQPHSPGAIIPSSPPKAPSARQLRRKLLKLRRQHEATLQAYYSLGTSSSEPVSGMLYSLASELGREDNDLLWLAIVGISSVELSPFANAKSARSESGRRILDKSEQMREVLRDEVRRLNPIPEEEIKRSQSGDIIPTKARSPTDCAIRLSPEPRFLLIRHWSLYDSMLHSPYLSTRLHMWSDVGRKRLHKLLAKMGISLQEAARGYMHMDTELKQSLRKRILKFAPQYNLDGLVPGEDGRRGLEGWGFVRSWGWKSTLSAVDIASVVSSILEVGTDVHAPESTSPFNQGSYQPAKSYNARMRALPSPPHSEDDSDHSAADPDYTTNRFFDAYDALDPIATSKNAGLNMLLKHIPTAQYLARAILRTGSALISKKQIRHLRSFRMGVVKEGPDVALFSHPGALVKLAAWVGEAVAVLEAEKGRRKNDHEALVLGCLDEDRGVYVVVGLGSGGAGKKVRSKAEIRERENKKKRKAADKAAKKTERARKRRERKELQRERDEANGLLNSDDEEEEDESDVTESEASDSSDDSADDSDGELAQARKKRGHGLNRFGQAFQEVVEETGARVRIDSFEHSVVEVRKEDLAGFLEALSLRSVVG